MSDDNHKLKTKSSDSSSRPSLTVNRLKRSKSSDKTNKYSDSFDQMEAHYYDKLCDIRPRQPKEPKDKTNANESASPIVSEEEIKNMSSASKSPLFPSLPDVILRKLQLLRENSCSLESLTEQEVESKFATLSIAFKTDKQTLEQRVTHHKYHRDVAEADAQTELKSLRGYVQQLNRLISSSEDIFVPNFRPELKEMLHKIETQVDVIGHTNAKISSISELYGAVKQEERVSSAFDVVLLYSENLIRAKDKERKELERMKKVLNSNGQKKTDFDTDSDNESVPLRRSIRSISTTVIPKMSLIRVRRASVSSIEILPNSDTHRKSIQPTVGARYVSNSHSYLVNRSRRCSMPVTPMTRIRTAADTDCSLLEMTAEEKGGSESDISSLTNEASDEEQKRCNKLSEELDSNSSNNSELNNNSSKTIITTKNEINDLISRRFSHEMSDKSDDSSDEMPQSRERMPNEPKESHKTLINIIEYNYLITLFNICFDGRVGTYVKRVVQDMRFILAVVLLVAALVIVIWSMMPSGIPCECHCTYSWDAILKGLAHLKHSKGGSRH